LFRGGGYALGGDLVMRAILEFNLPEDDNEWEMASHSSDAYAVIWDFDNRLREIVKYEDHSADVSKMVQKLREELNELCVDRGVVPDGIR
jgi:hypothetical protein